MTHEELQPFIEISNGEPFLVRKRLRDHIATIKPSESTTGPQKGTWTDNQRKAFHKGCEELANHLNEHGKDMRAVLKHDVDIPWTKDTVKEFIFRPIMKALYGYESHTELKKIEEVSKLWDVAFKHLGERVEVEYMEFPNDKARNEMQMWAKPVSKLPDYPVDVYEGEGPNFDTIN